MTEPQRTKRSEAADIRPVVEILARIRLELEEIARRIDHTQSVIAQSTSRDGALDITYIQAMQDADLNAQRVAGLATYLGGIAEACSPQWRVETKAAAAALTLAEMAQAMIAPQYNRSFVESADAGEVDLF